MKKLTPIFLIFFLQGVIHNIGHPITPSLLRSLDIPNFMFGLYFSMMSLGLMFGGPFWGAIGDRGKKKWSIFLGLFIYSIGQFGFGYAGSALWMVFFRFISGFGVIALHILLISRLIETTEKEKQTQALGIVVALSLLGSGIGYWVGGWVATNPLLFNLILNNQMKQIFLIQALANIILAAFIWLIIDEKGIVNKTLIKQSFLGKFRDIKADDHSIFLFFIALFFITMGNINITKYLEVYFIDLGYTAQDLGTYSLVSNLVALITSLLLVPIISKFSKQRVLMIYIYIISSVLVVIVFRSAYFLVMMYSLFLVFVMLRTVFTPLEQGYIAKTSKQNKYGVLMGIRQSFVSFGMVIGPLIGGLLYDLNPKALFYSSALMFIIGIIILIFYNHLHQKRNALSTINS
jgi:MFS family permease